MTGKVKEAQMLVALVETRAHLNVLLELEDLQGVEPFHNAMRTLAWAARDLCGVGAKEFDESAQDLAETWCI